MAGAGLETGLTLLALLWLGHWADGCFDTSPWLLLTALAMGLIATTYRLWRLGQRYFSSSGHS